MYDKNDFNRTAIILDDHQLFADALAKLVGELGLFQDIHSFSTEEELTQFLVHKDTKTPVYLLADYYLEGKTVIPIIGNARRLYKNLCIIIVSSVTNPVTINNVLSYRINGIVNKTSGTSELIECIKQVAEGKVFLSEYIQNILDQYKEAENVPFSTREIEILSYIAEGLTVEATAKVLNLSRHTIAAHKRKMFLKSNSTNIAELLAYARKIELI